MVARRERSLSEIVVGWRSGRSSGRQTSSTRIGAARPQGRTIGGRSRLRHHSLIAANMRRDSDASNASAEADPTSIHLQVLNEVLDHSVAQSGMPGIVPGRILADFFDSIGAEHLQYIFPGVGQRRLDAGLIH